MNILRLLFDLWSSDPLLSLLVTIIIVLVAIDCSRYLSVVPPGPWGVPWLGYLPFLGNYPEITLSKLRKEYGNIFSLYLGNTLVIVLGDYKLIREAFSKTAFTGRPPGSSTNYKILPEDKGLVSSDGKYWHTHRRFIIRTFRDLGIGKQVFEDKIQDEIDYFLGNLVKFKGEPMNPCDSLSMSIANIICLIECGRRFDYSHEKFISLCRLSNEITKFVDSTGFRRLVTQTWSFRLLYNLNLSWKAEAESIKEKFTEIFMNLIREHEDAYLPGSRRNYIDAFLTERKQTINKSRYNDQFEISILTDNLFELFVAGVDPVVASLRWTFLQLMHYPEVQKKLHAEIDEVVGTDRIPSYSDISYMPYSEAIIYEVQRVASIIPLGVIHCNHQATTLAGYRIPKRTHVISNIWAVHHDEALWKDPEEFRPERFIKNGRVERPPYLIPFSIGKRSCLGESLAMMELFLYMTSVFQRFELELPSNKRFSTVTDLGILRTPRPYKMKAIPRPGYTAQRER